MSTKQKFSSVLLLIFSFFLITVNLLPSTTKNFAQSLIALEVAPEFDREVQCLAENIYFESGYEPKEGQVAVAFVTLNRLKSGIFAEDICGVVKQKINNVCQFSWYCEDRQYNISTNKSLTSSNNSLYNSIRELATNVYANSERMTDPSNGALYYHADYVKPGWKNMQTTAVIGRHIFYNKKGI